jgi:hypothetical protein
MLRFYYMTGKEGVGIGVSTHIEHENLDGGAARAVRHDQLFRDRARLPCHHVDGHLSQGVLERRQVIPVDNTNFMSPSLFPSFY